eukprot:scaffold54868_cov61-Phaeocystis_antarctica.AAC.5
MTVLVGRPAGQGAPAARAPRPLAVGLEVTGLVWTVRTAAFSEIFRGIASAGAAAGAGAAADGANKAAAEQAKSEEKAAASKLTAAFKDDRNAAVAVLVSGGAPTGIGACTPSRSPCRRCRRFVSLGPQGDWGSSGEEGSTLVGIRLHPPLAPCGCGRLWHPGLVAKVAKRTKIAKIALGGPLRFYLHGACQTALDRMALDSRTPASRWAGPCPRGQTATQQLQAPRRSIRPRHELEARRWRLSRRPN